MYSHFRVLVIILCLSSSLQFAAFQNNPESEESNKEYLLSDLKENEIFDFQSIGNIKKEKGNSLGTLISLKMSDANLIQILKAIASENKINFVYDDRLLNIKGVTINYEDKPLHEVLDELLGSYNISYFEYSPREIALAKQIRIDETTGGIKGTIKDEKGEKLFGTNILIRELGIGTTSDANGNYSIRKVKPGEYTLEISYVGYEKIIRRIKINEGGLLELNFTMKETSFQIGGIEVVGTVDLLPRDVNTKTTISSGEIEHFQASSVKDVLDLVPGVQKTDNPGLGKTTQVALRGDDSDNASTFGTLVVVDGAPISNNANLQFTRPSGSTFGTSNLNGGVDLRTIPADNIQNIEITTGLASVKYGDATSGVISIKSKTGATPNRIKVKNNPDTREANFEGGLKFGESTLNYNLNAAQSSRDVRVSGDEYLRLTGQVVYSTNLFDNSVSTNNKILYQRILDEEQPKGDMLQTKNYNRGYTLSYTSWGSYKLVEDVSSIDYNLYASMKRENSMKSKLVTDYVIYNGDTLNSYIGKTETRGIEWNIGGRIEYNSSFITGNYIHKVLFGIEPQYNANTGEGVVLDTILNYHGQGSGVRPYSFDKIPGQLLLGLYAEDKITGHFIFDFNLMLGFRYEMYKPLKFNLSGLWGDGDLVESQNGSFFNPRMNLMVYLSKTNQFRFSIGTSSKSPSLGTLYPPERVSPWRNPIEQKNYFFRQNLWQRELKGYKEAIIEASYDHKFFDKIGTSFTGYFKRRTGSNSSISIPIFAIARLSNGNYRAYLTDTYSRNTNLGETETKGLEFSIRTSKIESLNLDFTITGSYSYINYFGSGSGYSTSPNINLGQIPNYRVPSSLVDTLIGFVYPRSNKWNDRIQINYALRYTLPALGLWITLRAEQLLSERNQSFQQTPIDLNLASESEKISYLFSRELKTKPNKWLFSFNMSKSLFKGAEVSFYVNNFFDDPATRIYYINPTDQADETRNPPLFYGLEFSMIFDSFTK